MLTVVRCLPRSASESAQVVTVDQSALEGVRSHNLTKTNVIVDFVVDGWMSVGVVYTTYSFKSIDFHERITLIPFIFPSTM